MYNMQRFRWPTEVQLTSSLLSEQSLSPSQMYDLLMHRPFAHWNSLSSLQPGHTHNNDNNIAHIPPGRHDTTRQYLFVVKMHALDSVMSCQTKWNLRLHSHDHTIASSNVHWLFQNLAEFFVYRNEWVVKYQFWQFCWKTGLLFFSFYKMLLLSDKSCE